MTEEEFRTRLTLEERDRLDECADQMALCAEKGTYSFMAYWAERVQAVLERARARMEQEDAEARR